MVVFVDISKQSGEQSWRTRRKMLAADEQVNVVRLWSSNVEHDYTRQNKPLTDKFPVWGSHSK
jgi:hypothetical protein